MSTIPVKPRRLPKRRPAKGQCATCGATATVADGMICSARHFLCYHCCNFNAWFLTGLTGCPVCAAPIVARPQPPEHGYTPAEHDELISIATNDGRVLAVKRYREIGATHGLNLGIAESVEGLKHILNQLPNPPRPK